MIGNLHNIFKNKTWIKYQVFLLTINEHKNKLETKAYLIMSLE